MFTVQEPPPPPTLESPHPDSVATELRRAVAHIRRALRQRAQAITDGGPALTGSEVELLRQIRRDPGLRVQDAAEALSIAPNSVSTLIKKLSAAGMVERSTDPSDGRVARLHLTERAQAFLAQMRDLREAAIADALAALEQCDQSAIADALPALGRLVEVLNTPTDTLSDFGKPGSLAIQPPSASTSQET